jgi:hypothetical protein
MNFIHIDRPEEYDFLDFMLFRAVLSRNALALGKSSILLVFLFLANGAASNSVNGNAI